MLTIIQGDVGLKIAYDGEDQGIGRIPNLILTPGNNLYDFRATVEVNTKTIQIIGGSGKPLTVGSNGTSINGVKIPWLSKPLEAMAVDVPVELDH